MTSDKIFIATILRNRLLNAAFRRGAEVKRGHSTPFTQRQIKSCKVALKAIMRGHFVLADKVLNACPEMRKAVFFDVKAINASAIKAGAISMLKMQHEIRGSQRH